MRRGQDLAGDVVGHAGGRGDHASGPACSQATVIPIVSRPHRTDERPSSQADRITV